MAGDAAGLELRLGRVNADAYIKDRIVHRDSAYEVGYYDDRVWTEKPEAYVRRALARALFDERGVTQLLSGVGATLDVDVVAFEEVRAPAHVARIELVYVVYDDRVVRLSRSVVVERPIAPAEGGRVGRPGGEGAVGRARRGGRRRRERGHVRAPGRRGIGSQGDAVGVLEPQDEGEARRAPRNVARANTDSVKQSMSTGLAR